MLRAKKPKQKPTARDRQRQETRRKLLDTARRLFAEHGVEGVSVTDIGEQAGVSHAMIYANFGDKAGLLYQIVAENNAPQLPAAIRAASLPGNPLDRLKKVLEVWARYDLAQPDLLAVMEAYSWTWSIEIEAENKKERAVHLKLVADLIREAKSEGTVKEHIDPDLAAEAIFAIYTWGLRGGVFEGLSYKQCVKHMWPQIMMILS
jgi:AcrR family transcriptional regulator